MRRWLPLLTLLLLAATADETRLLRVAETAFKDRLYDFAERQLAEFVDTFPASAQVNHARLLLAQAQLGQGKWEAATATLEAGVPPGAEWPVKFLYWRAEARAFGDQAAEATQDYRAVIERGDAAERQAALAGLAYSQFRLEQHAAAEQTIAELAALAPRGRLAPDVELLRGQIFLAQKKFEEAEAVFDAVIKRDRDSRIGFRAVRWRGELAAARGDTDRALRRFETVVESYRAQPNQFVDAQLAAEAWSGVGWVRWRAEEYGAAIEPFSQALALAREPRLRRAALVKLGEAYVRDGKLAQGVARLKDFIKENPRDPLAAEVQLAIGDLFFANGDFGAALAEYRELAARYPQSQLFVRAQSQSGWAALRQERPAEALPFFKAAFDAGSAAGASAVDRDLAEQALFKAADLQFELGQFPEAVASYQRFISSFPASALLVRAMFQLGHVYRRMQNTEAAAHVFGALVEQFPRGEFAPEALFEIALIQSAGGDEPASRASFATVIAQYPASPWTARARLAVARSFAREGAYPAAIGELDRLIAAAPDSSLAEQAVFIRGEYQAAQGQPEVTLAEFTSFLAARPESPVAPELYSWQGHYHAQQRDFIKAQESFQAIPRKYPQHPLAADGLYFAGRAAYSRQDYKGAIELFETLVKTYTNSAWRCDARFGQGDAFTELNQFEDALLVFDSLIKQFADCYLLCEAHGRKGDCQYTLQRYDDAIASYQQALVCAREADPSLRHQLYFKTGQSYEKAGKPDDAVAQYAKVVYETAAWPDPTLPPECFWLSKAGLAAGALKEQKQQWRDAITLYTRLVELCPDMKELLEERIRRIRVEHFIWF